jgi:hypothetical protein
MSIFQNPWKLFGQCTEKNIHTLTNRYSVAGMPSTHSMVGLAVPATVVYVTTGKYDISLSLGIAISW